MEINCQSWQLWAKACTAICACKRECKVRQGPLSPSLPLSLSLSLSSTVTVRYGGAVKIGPLSNIRLLLIILLQELDPLLIHFMTFFQKCYPKGVFLFFS